MNADEISKKNHTNFKKISWYNLEIKEICDKLRSSEAGLSDREAKDTLMCVGENSILTKNKISIISILANQFKSFFIFILFFAALLSLSLKEYVDASVIIFIISIGAVIGFIQDLKAEKSIESLNKLTSLKAIVVRKDENNKSNTVEIYAKELVPGDIVLLDTGSKIPADLRIIESNNLEIDESILTGESVPVEKSACNLKNNVILSLRKNMLYSGTIVTKGTAKAIVVETGLKTEIGKISKELNEIEEQHTPLQHSLDVFGKRIGIAVIIVCLFVFLTNTLRGYDFITSLLVAISLAVAAVPESLPAVVTISLSIGVRWLSKNNALVRKLSAVETLGCTSVICTDKTGTLTKNEMTVTQLFIGGKDISVTGKGYDSKGDFILSGKKIDITNNKEVKKIMEISSLCNNSSINFSNQEFTGDPTEVSLLVLAKKGNVDYCKCLEKQKRIIELPFDSVRKMMTTVNSTSSKGKYITCTKGAVQNILPKCKKILLNGKVISLTEKMRKEILKQNDKYADNALRVLSFAYKETKLLKNKENKEKYEQDLIFVGLVAMMDPPRIEVKDMITHAHEAGIKIIMITGDNINTAKAIGREVGIIGDAISGDELEKMSDEILNKRIDDIAIFARVSPSDKLRIVEILQKKGHVVSMTGDGVNDALALKKSDIGVAMGIRGCDVAKESASIILVDDSFKSIVLAIKEGRRIFDNIRKVVGYVLSLNIVEVLIVSLCAVVGLPMPLLAIQLLILNILLETGPAISLSNDPARKDIMGFSPRKKSEGIIDEKMKVMILFIAIMTTICCFTMYYFSDPYNHYMRAQSVLFAMLVIFEMAKLYIIRKQYGLSFFSNKILIGAIMFALSSLAILLYVPFFSAKAKLVPLTYEFGWIFGALFV
ncbi:MAG: cation-translocating P-type ATPase, partial [Candidatus Woesearchaeota archaeon]